MSALSAFIEQNKLVCSIGFAIGSFGIIGFFALIFAWASKSTETIIRPSDFGEEGEQ
jgi:hypothetical protein